MGQGDAITNIANQISGNITVDTYYADEDMQESVALGGTPVANAEQLREAIANADDGDIIFLASGEYVLDDSECFILTKRLVLHGSGKDTVIKATNSKDYNNGVFTFAGGSEGSVLRDMTISYQSTGAQSAAVYFNNTFTGGTAEKLTQIYNVDFIGGESLETIGSEIAISSTYSTNGPIGYIDIRNCSITNFAYGMYFCSVNNSTIADCTIDGTKYNAINIAADTNDESSVSENVSISSNNMTNISYANYEDEAYSCGIRIGLEASDVVLENNDIEMLHDKTPVYIDEPAEESDRVMVTYKDGESTIRTQLATANEEIVLPEALKKVGYVFEGWNDGKETYKAGASGKITEDTTFTAVWNKLPFTDVTADDWFAEAVTYVYDNGLMHGVSATRFAPQENLSRAMLVKVLYNLETAVNTKSTASDLFTDVPDGLWYTECINWAASNQLIGGYPDHTFRPNNAITRQEMMVILYRYAKYEGYDTTAEGDLSVFVDADQVADWANEAVNWAVGSKLIIGNGNKLNPNDTATRAEGAQLFERFFESIAH